MSSVPIISALPEFGGGRAPDDLAAASPVLQALLSQSGGPKGLQNVNSLAASNPQFGQILSLLSPGGGLSPQQASQFGPIFALMMALQGGTGTPGMAKGMGT